MARNKKKTIREKLGKGGGSLIQLKEYKILSLPRPLFIENVNEK